ncbi:MAG TPA: hypothetical protein VMR31_04980 [Myxococcota bacterium]|nr:hypothetical protein [Myxococcota bacterium]
MTISRLSLAAAFLAALACPALRAGAGTTTITAHPLSISFRAVSQLTGDSGNQQPEKDGVRSADLYDACVFAPPTKTQGVFIFFDCSGPPPGTATILAIDTQPVTFKANVGTVEFGTPTVLTTVTAGTVLKSIKVPASVTISCPTTNTAMTLNGVLNLNYAAFPNNGPICPSSGSLKLTGGGTVTGIDSIIDDGSSIKINKRNVGINSIPAAP